MSQKKKLYQRLMSRPSDFSYEEARKLLASHGFVESTKGKTSGSRVAFIRDADQLTFFFHKPHPKNILKMYLIDELIDFINNLPNIEEGEYE